MTEQKAMRVEAFTTQLLGKYYETFGEQYVFDEALSLKKNWGVIGSRVMEYKHANRTPEEIEKERVIGLEMDAYYARNGGD
tara:strand:+ start:620 stop:862 length:243 start_codon:yes stop_codon:yes gene_type:complete